MLWVYLIIRIEIFLPGFIICSSLQYNSIITFHGLFMIFFMIMPILIGGFGNFLIPLLLCCSDMIFPRLNALSLWLIFSSLFIRLVINYSTLFLAIMFSALNSNLIYNEIEYFTYINIWLISLFMFIIIYIIIVSISLLFISTISINDCSIELISTFTSIIFLITIISPSLLILLESNINALPSFLIQSIGYQWAWSFNIVGTSLISYIDHYIVSSGLFRNFVMSLSIKFSCWLYSWFSWILTFSIKFSCYILTLPINLIYAGLTGSLFWINRLSGYSIGRVYLFLVHIPYYFSINYDCLINEIGYNIRILEFMPIISIMVIWFLYLVTGTLIDVGLRIAYSAFINVGCFPSFYMNMCNCFVIMPLWSAIRLFINSIDVIHSLGCYSFGIKVDAIPGRINLAYTLRSLIKGEYRGFCYELCGSGHSAMQLSLLII